MSVSCILYCQRVSPVIDVEYDAGSDEDSIGGEVQSLEFLKDIIVTPPNDLKKMWRTMMLLLM
jgi:hypothetical protein